MVRSQEESAFQSETKDGERREGSGFGSEDVLSERYSRESCGSRRGELGFGPPAFRTDGKGNARPRCNDLILSLQTGAQGRSLAIFREHESQISGGSRKSLLGANGGANCRRAETPRLLRGFNENLFPTSAPFFGCGKERFVRARGREGDDFRDSQFRGFFKAPLKAIEFYDGDQEFDAQGRFGDRKRLDEREQNAAAAAPCKGY